MKTDSSPDPAEVDANGAQSRLREALLRCERLLVAYSGGVDSSLVLDAAVEALGPGRVLGVIARSETLTDREFQQAMDLARERSWPVREIAYSELDIPNYAGNPANRCYFCKRELYTRLRGFAQREGFTQIADGTNASDLGDHRPGLRAVEELEVVSPLREAGMTKEMVRAEAQRRGLANWDKPAAPCLSSRFPYGTKITREGLDEVAAAEGVLHDLGFRTCRVRHHGQVARLEVPAEELPRLVEPGIRERIVAALKEIGFLYVALDLQGFRSGSLNEALRADKRE